MKDKALILDRDGVVCEAFDGYLTSFNEFKLMDGINDLITYAKENRYKIFIVTNQPQISKGFLSKNKLTIIHKNMEELLENKVNKVYYCPHQDNDDCICRKPKPGMLFNIEKEFKIDFKKSFIIGDSYRDIEAGIAVGCKTIFVKNKLNAKHLELCSPDYTVNNLKEIISIIQ